MKTQELIDRIERLSLEKQKILLNQITHIQQSESSRTNLIRRQSIQAYVVPETGLNKENLKSFLKSKLPEYMIPVIQYFEVLPKLPNGKIDINALNNQKNNSLISKEIAIQESTSLQRELIEIWETYLNFSPVSIHDNFYEIGGDSILSIQIISKAKKHGTAPDRPQRAPRGAFRLADAGARRPARAPPLPA